MRFTIHDTLGVVHLIRGLSWLILKLSGWKIINVAPPNSSYIIITAPHTSNWDFPLGIAIAFHLKLRVYFIGKHTLFKGPLGPAMRWLGGIPINRNASENFVDASIETYNTNPNLVMSIAPEGTRTSVTRWKTGFYHIAKGANIPIALAFFDFSTKTGGIGGMLNTTDDMDADMQTIADFYRTIVGKIPANYNTNITGTALDPKP